MKWQEHARAVSPSLHIPTFPPGKPMASTKEKRSPPCGANSWQRQQRQLDWESASLGKSHDKGNVILVTENTRKVYAVLEADQIQPPCAWLSVTERDLEVQENGFLVLRKTAGVVISLCELGLPVKCLLVHLLESTSSRECKCRLALSITEVVCSEHYEKKRKTQCYIPTRRWQNAGGQRQNHDPKLQMGRLVDPKKLRQQTQAVHSYTTSLHGWVNSQIKQWHCKRPIRPKAGVADWSSHSTSAPGCCHVHPGHLQSD